MQKFKALKFLVITLFVFSSVVVSFGQADIARQTTAITYPLDEIVQTQFRGTTRFPRMKGEARIKRTSRNGTEIELSVSKMPRPFELGAGYATYVLWAVSPDGQIDNLGEIRRRGFFEFDSKISVTTPLQTFALIITAEPHFLVRRPSQAIMLENLSPYAKSGATIATMRAVQYFGNSSDFFRDARTPEIAEIDYAKTPSTILQAKQALALARYAGAERDATEEFRQAETLLQSAEAAWKAERPEEQIDITARQAVSAAVKAEATAAIRKEAREKRNERTRQDAEMRLAEAKYSDAQTQIDELRSELARETERQASEQQNAEQNRIMQIQANEPVLMQNLKRFGTVARTERGIVLTMPENLWSGMRVSGFAPTADGKISSLGETLAATGNAYKITIESHTDNKGTPDELQILTQERAQAIADKFTAFGVPQDRIEAKGYGANLPTAANTTNVNRAKNRRVQVILTPAY
jgi:outer membrane protein OmpA-like peptidoglycan-associated protein